MNSVEEMLANYKAVKKRLANPPNAIDRAIGLQSAAGLTTPSAPTVGAPKLTTKPLSPRELYAGVFKRAAERFGYKPPKISRERLLEEVAREYGLTPDEVMERTRRTPVVFARGHYFARLKDERQLSFSQIGKMHGFDHTSVMHAYNKHHERVNAQRETAA